MMSPRYESLFESWEIGVAKNVIDGFKRKWKCLDKEGFDDLLQECLAHWHFAKSEYDPTAGASTKTFMARVVRNKLFNIIEKYDSDKRRIVTESISLDEPLNEDDSSTLLDTIPAPGDSFYQIRIQTELKIELTKAHQKLTPRQKRLCDLLSEANLSIKEISEELGVNRKRVYEDLDRIRAIFENEGLKNYLL